MYAPRARSNRRGREAAAAARSAALMLGALLAGAGGSAEKVPAPCASQQAVRGEIYWPADERALLQPLLLQQVGARAARVGACCAAPHGD